MEYTELQLQSTPASRWELRGALSRTSELNNRKFATRSSVENIQGNLSGQIQSLKNECRSRLGSLESNQSNWATKSSFTGLLNALKTVAFSGSYTDLTNTPFTTEGLALRIGGNTGGANSIVLGSNSTASSYSVALGDSVQANTGWSAAFGDNTKANYAYTFAAGRNNTAIGSGSAVFGIGMTASGSASFACGLYGYNTADLSVGFKIGVGANDNNRCNLVEICDFNNADNDDGAMYIFGIGGYDGTNAKPFNSSTPGPDSLQKVITNVNTRLSDLETALSSSSSSPEYIAYSTGQGYSIGDTTTASGENAFAEGYNTKAQGTASHAEGSGSKAIGLESHAEGYDTYAGGNYSHAEGTGTQTSGTYSHAEGYYTMASGESSHAEGANTSALGTRSHAEGYRSKAMGNCTHAEGSNTLARNTGEHACGTYNKSTQDVTLFSIGNGYEGQQGAPDTRQNAFEVDLNSNVYIKGIGNYDGTNIGESGVESVQQVIADLTLQIAALANNL